jgi:penicillin-binding protein 2
MLIENPAGKHEGRLRILSLGVVAAAALLIFNLHKIQVKEGEIYAATLRNQTTVPVILSPARGSIVDRNGIGLAENKASIDVDVYLRELVGYYTRSKKGQVPKTLVPGKQVSMPNVAFILEESAGEVFTNLALKREYTDRDLLRHYYQSPNVPFQLVRNLDFSQLSKFSENSVNIPGIQESARPVRTYNFGALAPHLLGYVGKVEEVTQSDFVPESVGKEGLEKSLDEYLQGKPGYKMLRKNNVGYILGAEAIQQPSVGGTVYLSIDARIQNITEQAMRRVGRGAAVVMDVQTGDILAMVSVPSFDPNSFTPTLDPDEWKRLSTDSTKPLTNRALSTYPAGSTFKTLVALAALANPKINFTPHTRIYSPSAVFIANRWWPDWPGNVAGEGDITLHTAMQWSTNTFFYQLGVRTGGDSMAEMGKKIGLGQKLLVDEEGHALLPGEMAGQMPGPQWMEDRENRQIAIWKETKKKDPAFKIPRTWRERWSDGHSANTSIGQGFVSVSPLQMAILTSAVANGGDILYPRLVRAITQMEGTETKLLKEYPVRKRGELGVKKEHLNALRASMKAVVEGGTGKKAASGDPQFPVSGKTGTAQFTAKIQGAVVKDLKTWFTGFAPYDEPRYAIVVMVEGGTSGGSTSAPIVGEILKEVNAIEKGSSIDMVYLNPAIGHYMGVTSPLPTQDVASALPENLDAALPIIPEDESADRESGAAGAVQDFMNRRRR